MNPKKFVVVQTILEAIIPVFGFFYWKWNASFIFFFYLIDWILFYTLSALKAKKSALFVQISPEEKKKNQIQLVVGILSILLTSLFVYFLLFQIHNPFSWIEQFWNFLTFEDMGIPQGIILIPLLVLNGVLDYKKRFIAPKLYQIVSPHLFTITAAKQGVIATILFGIGWIVSYAVQLTDDLVYFVTVFGVLTFRLILRKPFGF